MHKFLAILLIACFSLTGIHPVSAEGLILPAPGTRINLSPAYNPPVLKGIKVYPNEPLRFNFIVDGLNGPRVTAEAPTLIKYFLTALTTPEKDLWVNLSPYEQNRIVADSFGRTEMGRDLLAQDYMLKQITASLIYPEGETGKKFWKQVYEQAGQSSSVPVPINAFNKVWIVPSKAVVYENVKTGTAYVVEATLNVMLEEDYLAVEKNRRSTSIGNKTGNIIRELVIPVLTKEVNEGRNFAQLRQVYNALVLAAWYKKKIKNSILNAIYTDRNKTDGVNADDPQAKQKIYTQYLQAFKKGVFSYIKVSDTNDLASGGMPQERVPRKYFAGGFHFDAAQLTYTPAVPDAAMAMPQTKLSVTMAPIDSREKVLDDLSRGFASMTIPSDQTKYIPNEIMILFDIADKLNMPMVISGGTARDFVVHAFSRQGKRGTFFVNTDYDVLIPVPDSREMYNSDAYRLFDRELGEKLNAMGYGPSEIRKLKLDFLPGVLTPKEGYVLHNLLNAVGEGSAFSISRLAVYRKPDGSFIVFGRPEAIDDMKNKIVDIWIAQDKDLEFHLAAHMLAKSAVYKQVAGFEFSQKSRHFMIENLRRISRMKLANKRAFIRQLYGSLKLKGESNEELSQRFYEVINDFHLNDFFAQAELGIDANKAMVTVNPVKTFKFDKENIHVAEDTVTNNKINVHGQFITMNPGEVDVRVSVEEDMVNRDIVDDPMAKRRDGAGRSVREFVEGPSTPRRDDILMAFNGITGNFYDANSAVLIDGKLIVKGRRADGGPAKGIGQKTDADYKPLNGTFWFLPFDQIASGEDPIKEAIIQDGVLKTNLGYKNGIFGAVIIRNGDNTVTNDDDRGNEYITLKSTPAIRGQDVNFTKTKREAVSAMGYTKDGKLFRATLIGDPNDRSRGNENEPTIDEFVSYLLQKGAHNVIVTGTVADVKTYIKEAAQPYTAAKERMGVISKEGLLAQGLDASIIDEVFTYLIQKQYLSPNPMNNTTGMLTNFSNDLIAPLTQKFGPKAHGIIKAIQATANESFLGNIFTPRSRPNATHIIVYKRNPDMLLPDRAMIGASEIRRVLISLFVYTISLSTAHSAEFFTQTTPWGRVDLMARTENGDTLTTLVNGLIERRVAFTKSKWMDTPGRAQVWNIMLQKRLIDRNGVAQQKLLDADSLKQVQSLLGPIDEHRRYEEIYTNVVYMRMARRHINFLDAEDRARIKAEIERINPQIATAGITPGQELNMNEAWQLRDIRSRLKAEEIIAHKVINVGDTKMDFYFIDTSNDPDFTETIVGRAYGTTVFINLNSTIRQNRINVRRPGELDRLKAKLRETGMHELAHALTIPDIDGGHTVIYAQPATSVQLSSTHEASGWLGGIVGASNPHKSIEALEQSLENADDLNAHQRGAALILPKIYAHLGLDPFDIIVENLKANGPPRRPVQITNPNFGLSVKDIPDVRENLFKSGYIDKNALIVECPFLRDPKDFQIEGAYSVEQKKEIYKALVLTYDSYVFIHLNNFWKYGTMGSWAWSHAATLGPLKGISTAKLWGMEHAAARAIHKAMFGIDLPPAETIIIPPDVINYVLRKYGGNDKAMSGAVQREGGIDFKLHNVTIKTNAEGQGINFHLDPVMLKQLQNAPGFVPVIINIEPMIDLKAFLGIAQAT